MPRAQGPRYVRTGLLWRKVFAVSYDASRNEAYDHWDGYPHPWGVIARSVNVVGQRNTSPPSSAGGTVALYSGLDEPTFTLEQDLHQDDRMLWSHEFHASLESQSYTLAPGILLLGSVSLVGLGDGQTGAVSVRVQGEIVQYRRRQDWLADWRRMDRG